MAQISADELEKLAAEFSEGSLGLALLGSHARGTANRVSDVDVVRFVEDLPAERYTLFIREDRLVSLTSTTLAEKQAQMGDPSAAILAVPGLRQMKVLYDPGGLLALLHQAALDFRWEHLGNAPAEFASRELMGLSEEVHKVISALQRQDDLAALYGAYGLVLGLARVMLVARGTLVESENRLFEAAQTAGGSGWARSFRMAAGFDRWPGDRAEVTARALAAIDVYVQTARMLLPELRPEPLEVVNHTLQVIAVETPYP